MIKVTLTKNTSSYDKLSTCEVIGHAREDVCAAVSALTQAAWLGLRSYNPLQAEPEVDEEKGLFKFIVHNYTQNWLSVSVIMRVMRIGLTELSAKYPSELEVTYIKGSVRGVT